MLCGSVLLIGMGSSEKSKSCDLVWDRRAVQADLQGRICKSRCAKQRLASRAVQKHLCKPSCARAAVQAELCMPVFVSSNWNPKDCKKINPQTLQTPGFQMTKARAASCTEALSSCCWPCSALTERSSSSSRASEGASDGPPAESRRWDKRQNFNPASS